MTLAIVHSRGLVGMEAPPVSVEVHLANGLPAFNIVGLPDTEVRESRERVRAALQSSGFDFPNRRITVNLAPADLPKGSGRFDLPIAIGILAASSRTHPPRLAQVELMGELSLTGELRPIHGALIMALALRRSEVARDLVLPAASAAEAAPAQWARTRAVHTLTEVWGALTGQAEWPAPPSTQADGPDHGALAGPPPDLAEVRGQGHARRALEIAAAGGHGLLLSGPPGSGKSMLAQRLPSLLPPMTHEEALESAAIHSLVRRTAAQSWGQRPFRAPHHSATAAAMVGGGRGPEPGEVSLAHRGVLFLDELAEFRRDVLESLREPLENGRVAIARAGRHAEFPAAFQLVAATNPCPCGWFGSACGRCRCTPDAVARYRGRLSGPLLDRIDMHVEVPSLSRAELLGAPHSESSAQVRARAGTARERALARQGVANAALTPAGVDQHCQPDATGQTLLAAAIDRLSLSARAVPRLLKLARSIADLADAAAVGATHVAEALSYRRAG